VIDVMTTINLTASMKIPFRKEKAKKIMSKVEDLAEGVRLIIFYTTFKFNMKLTGLDLVNSISVKPDQ
jgi:hypothetical protein